MTSFQPSSSHASDGPVRPTVQADVAQRPVRQARITGGFWAARRNTNAVASIASGPSRLEASGNLENFRRAAAGVGEFVGDFQFQDTDVYKWLEAACWQLADPEPPAELAAEVERVVGLIAAAQQDDGYLQTYYQLGRGTRWTELGWGHELYCAGHLIQAAVAHHRVTGHDTLLTVAVRLADHIDSVFGPGQQADAVCGHPEIETALVELYRETSEPRYLQLAGYFIDRRGTGTLTAGVDRGHDRDPGAAFWQDHVLVREADSVAGHAVRQLYLLAGAADVADETSDTALRAAVLRLWDDMVSTKAYITGGVGSRYDWESFGDTYELPADRAYAETCAAIASIQLSWRLALATGEARYSDLVERTLYNGFLAGVGLDGDSWLYVNPLHVRSAYTARPGDQTARRTAWFRCACCPPNAMRLLASLPYYVAAVDTDGLALHQYASGVYGDDGFEVEVETDYPWNGRVRVVVRQTPEDERTLSLRIPAWCKEWTCKVNGTAVDRKVEDGWLRLPRDWQPGDELGLELLLAPRLTEPHPRVDAVRGCVAIERGPLVYCLEQVDQADDVDLDGIALPANAQLATRHLPAELGEGIAISAQVFRHPAAASTVWPQEAGAPGPGPREHVAMTAVPYALWDNRAAGAMRVWVPVRSS